MSRSYKVDKIPVLKLKTLRCLPAILKYRQHGVPVQRAAALLALTQESILACYQLIDTLGVTTEDECQRILLFCDSEEPITRIPDMLPTRAKGQVVPVQQSVDEYARGPLTKPQIRRP